MNSAAAPDTRRPQRPRRSPLWWVYLAYLLIAGVLGSAALVSRSGGLRSLPPRELALAAAGAVINVWGLVGLWAYVTSKPLGARALWKPCFAITAAQVAFSASQFARVLWTAPHLGSSLEKRVAWVGLASLLLAMPLLLALWRYAFRSSDLWRAGRGTA